jgi:DNA-binding response OmpR family regulator
MNDEATVRRMLVVDDEDAIAYAISRYFRRRGYHVDTSSELEQAKALLSKGRYSIVIADLRLTGVHGAEGLEILSHVRAVCPTTQTILLTAYGSESIELEARERGASLVLHKPQALPDLAVAVMALAEGDP